MAKKTLSPRPRPAERPEDVPVLIIPRQTADDIRRRMAIREALHDVRARTISGRDRKKAR